MGNVLTKESVEPSSPQRREGRRVSALLRVFGPRPEQDRIFGLDLLRATSICCIVVAHSTGMIRLTGSQAFRYLDPLGFFAVEMFFGLSGHLIGGILLRLYVAGRLRTVSDLFGFWKRRWMRTLPNYYLYLVLLVAFMPPTPGNHVSWRYFFFLQNLAYPHPPFFPEAWTLAVEEWFYLLIPLFIAGAAATVAPSGNGKKRIGLTLLGLVLLCAAGRALYVAIENPTFDEETRKVVALRLDGVLIGVLAAFVSTFYRDLWLRWRWPALACGVVFLVSGYVTMLRVNLDQSFFCRTALFSLTSFGFACVLPAASQWVTYRSRLGKTIEFISIISYSLYLVHYSMAGMLLYYVAAVAPALSVIAPVIYLVTIVGFASATYFAFERPILNLRDRARLS